MIKEGSGAGSAPKANGSGCAFFGFLVSTKRKRDNFGKFSNTERFFQVLRIRIRYRLLDTGTWLDVYKIKGYGSALNIPDNSENLETVSCVKNI